MLTEPINSRMATLTLGLFQVARDPSGTDTNRVPPSELARRSYATFPACCGHKVELRAVSLRPPDAKRHPVRIMHHCQLATFRQGGHWDDRLRSELFCPLHRGRHILHCYEQLHEV